MNKNIQELKAKLGSNSRNSSFVSIKGGSVLTGDKGIDFGINADLCNNTKDCTESTNKRICTNVNVCRSI